MVYLLDDNSQGLSNVREQGTRYSRARFSVSSSRRLVSRDVPLDAASFDPALSANNKSCQTQTKQTRRKRTNRFIRNEKNSRNKTIGGHQHKRSTKTIESSSNPSRQKAGKSPKRSAQAKSSKNKLKKNIAKTETLIVESHQSYSTTGSETDETEIRASI